MDIIRTDDEKEFLSDVSRMCDQKKVKRELITMSTPKLSGRAERTIVSLDATGIAARLHVKENYPGLPVNLDSS